jgi:hypothetical protein
MCSRIAGAEKTGEWESRIWTLRSIGERVNAARTAGGKKNDEWKPPIRLPGWIGEKVSAARRLLGFLNK